MKIVAWFFALLFVIGVVLGGSLFWDSYVISPSKNASESALHIEEGMSVNEIAQLLKDQKLIQSSFFFKVYVKFADAQSGLKAGDSIVKPGMSYRSLVNILSHAKVQDVQITFPEGYTLNQMGQSVMSVFPTITEEEWQETVLHPSDVSVGLELVAGIPSGQSLEGYLFPDTYRFQSDTQAKTISETMLVTLSRRLAEAGIVVPTHLVMSNGMTLHEVLTLASIVEREVRTPEDMAHVAGIFLTRLEIGMALQADATVNYVTGKKDAAITLEDSKVDSPYNTYTHLGLPPGPISNPGINAIKAVLNPMDSDDLYYLTSQDGTVFYAQTFDQHIANKYKYLN